MKKKINKKEEKENQVIENNIKINIDLNDLKAKPEKKKKRRVKKKKPLNPEDLLKNQVLIVSLQRLCIIVMRY